MSEPVRYSGQMPSTRGQQQQQAPAGGGGGGGNLADILERVLDKGIVIAGDIQINLLDIELLTIKLRLVVASVDKAKEMGIDWWERDPTLSSGHQDLIDENQRLRTRLEALENGRPEALAAGDEGEQDEGDEGEQDEGEQDEADEDVDDEAAEADEIDELDDEDRGDGDGDEDAPEPVEDAPRRARKRSAGAARRSRS